MLVMIDNYDSFTYNLVQYFGDLGQKCHVVRNDEISARAVFDLKPDGVVLSPGPSDPDNAGICLDTVKIAQELGVPLLGVCLGHQAIGQAFGGKVVRAKNQLHGKRSRITHFGTDLFKDIPSPITVARYHSLIVERASLPECLAITAQSENATIMGVAHKTKPIYGIQFHPESIATDSGHKMLQNFCDVL